mgnify:CR=1 FL=1
MHLRGLVLKRSFECWASLVSMRRWWRCVREVCAAPEPICAPERRAAAARSGRGVDEGCRAGRAGSVRSSGMRLSTISCYGVSSGVFGVGFEQWLLR